MPYPVYTEEVPYLSAAQMVEVDRAMIEDFRIELIQMMENAGRNLAHLARRRFLDGDPLGKKVVVLAGAGGNGGGALVAARRLYNWGAGVRVFTTRPAQDFKNVSAHQLDILRRMKVPVDPADAVTRVGKAELIVDGLIGYSLRGAPAGAAAVLIRWANAQKSPVLSLDAPSGVDTTTGAVFDPAIRATATMTLALPKEGLRVHGAKELIGELYLADIGVPPGLYAEPAMALSVGPLFARQDVIRLS
jgi:NAD(P)H-hydrate epimerase